MNESLSAIVEVQKYVRSIHIMAMLLVGFGFLMVFVKRYGGVAIGSTCDKVPPTYAFLIGVIAGALSTFGFAAIQERLQNLIKKVDTCGVLHLHGLPGLFGGLAAMVAVEGINRGTQITGILITVVLAIVSGLVVGKVIALFGKRNTPYTDSEEFVVD